MALQAQPGRRAGSAWHPAAPAPTPGGPGAPSTPHLWGPGTTLSLAGPAPCTPGGPGGHLPTLAMGHLQEPALGCAQGNQGAMAQAIGAGAQRHRWGQVALGGSGVGAAPQAEQPGGVPAPRCSGSSTYLLDFGPVFLHRQTVHGPRDAEEAAEEARCKPTL